jgi:hypothetical protein
MTPPLRSSKLFEMVHRISGHDVRQCVFDELSGVWGMRGSWLATQPDIVARLPLKCSSVTRFQIIFRSAETMYLGQ